jgi:coenzyme F420 hydrogenase subunit beta
MAKFRSVHDAAAWRLCVGCGACACACPERRIRLVDVEDDGIRPVLSRDGCDGCGMCLRVCPGVETAHDAVEKRSGTIPELLEGFGPVLELWEGYAADPDIRFRGSSGGLTTALALFCLEKEGMHAVLHTGADEDVPWKNRTVLSRTWEDLLGRTGSRYLPASPCDGLDAMASAQARCVFIGKPCDVVGTMKSADLRPDLAGRIGVTIAFFCAGTPSTRGVLEMLRSFEVSPEEVESIRFRGNGWPGTFTAKLKRNTRPPHRMTYLRSWGFLQKYRPYRCHLCPDGTGEFADLSCGDPWYRGISDDEPGRSLVLVRTQRGRTILRGAVDSGYVILRRVEPWVLKESQKNLLGKRQAVWGRLLAMRLLGVPTPEFQGFPLFRNWRRLPLREKLKSTVGTARRVVQRGYYRKRAIPDSAAQRT